MQAIQDPPAAASSALTLAEELRALALASGADDAGLVSLDRPELAGERKHAEEALPGARALLAFCVRMNREPIRSPARSVANHEFHRAGEDVGLVGRRIVRALEERGLRALDPSLGFPMEMDRYPGRTWVIAHKTVAVAAGLGAVGIHRNVIHPRFGSFILLGTVVVAAEAEEESRPLDFNPCVACKLCVAACPVGAISADGRFDFSACVTHNYREFMGGFTDWVENVAEAGSAVGYRRRVQDSESASMWQSLAFGPNYKAAYCLAVCPAGEDVITPFRDDRAEFLARVVRPLQAKEEPVYVMAGTDAEHVARRFPHKTVRRVGKVLRPTTVAGFLRSLPLAFQPGQAGDLRALVHFRFTGREAREATVRIEGGALTVDAGLAGRPDVTVTADSAAWLRFARGELGLLSALLTLRIRLRGSPRVFMRFGRCFPR